jgi:hypothetical protein
MQRDDVPWYWAFLLAYTGTGYITVEAIVYITVQCIVYNVYSVQYIVYSV